MSQIDHELKEIDNLADAERWRKLKRLVGSPRNATDSKVCFYWDDATMTQHIKIDGKHYGTIYGTMMPNFDGIMDSIPDVCPCCYENGCRCATIPHD